MLKSRVWSVALILFLAVTAAGAQQQQKDPRVGAPLPPLPSVPAGESSSKVPLDDPTPVPQNAMKSDERPLSGAEDFTLGSSAGGRSFVTPSFRFFQFGDNTRVTSTSNDAWGATGTLTGDLALSYIKSRSQLGIDYSGGSTIYETSNRGRFSYHRLGISEQLNFRRATILLADSMTYLPESSFGGGGFGGISSGLFGGLGNGSIGTGQGGLGGLGGGGIGLGLGGIGSGIVPGQSILTGTGRRISNTAMGQLQYMVSPRASMTFNGSYGILRFLDTGFINSSSYRFSAGYDYKLNAADSIAVTYSANLMRFQGINRSGDFHSVQLAYGRRLTGRLAMRISGGPQFGHFSNPVSGPGNRTSWTVHSSLLYSLRNTTFGVNYSHSANGGSGVLVGADADRVDGNIGRQITRMWNGGLVFGFAHNKSIQQLNAATAARSVNTWHTGFNLQRPLSRQVKLSFTYSLNGQSANNPTGCVGLACGRMPLRHQLALAISWGFGPYAID